MLFVIGAEATVSERRIPCAFHVSSNVLPRDRKKIAKRVALIFNYIPDFAMEETVYTAGMNIQSLV